MTSKHELWIDSVSSLPCQIRSLNGYQFVACLVGVPLRHPAFGQELSVFEGRAIFPKDIDALGVRRQGDRAYWFFVFPCHSLDKLRARELCESLARGLHELTVFPVAGERTKP